MSDPWHDAVDDYLRASRIAGDALNTQKQKHELMNRLAGWAVEQGVPLDGFKHPQLRAFLDTGKGKESTRRQYAIMVKHLFKYLKDEGYIEINHIAGFKLPKAPKPVLKVPTVTDLEKLLHGIDRRWSIRKRNPKDPDEKVNTGIKARTPDERRFYARRDSAIVVLLIGSTARISEILALDIERVNLDKGEIVIERGKGGKQRSVPLSEKARSYVQEWLRVRPEGGARLFVTLDGSPLTYSTFKGTFRRYKEFSGVEGFTIHRIRAFGLTTLAKQNPVAAQRIAGHASLSTTMRYVNCEESFIREQFEAADPLKKVLGGKQ